MRLRRVVVAIAAVAIVVVLAAFSATYVRAASLVVRAADLGGRLEALSAAEARSVTVRPTHTVPTRQGHVAAQFYEPSGRVRRSVLLVPGIHSMGIAEPRLRALAHDLAGSGLRVMAMALPDLQEYVITPRSTDVIEDALAWMAGQPDLAPDGRVGTIGISFAGGLALVAAGREAIRDRVAFVVSFGGHGDLPRVLTYLATGVAPQVPGIATYPPHDYGVAVILYGLADAVVPPEQVQPLRDGVKTFLLASQLTLVSQDEANAMFARARDMATALPEPARTLLTHVNTRNVVALGPMLVPHLPRLGADSPAGSPERTTSLPTAPIYLLHGDGDTVIPTAESAVLAGYLQSKRANVRVLLSGLITHAEVNRGAAASEGLRLVSFWASVLRQ